MVEEHQPDSSAGNNELRSEDVDDETRGSRTCVGIEYYRHVKQGANRLHWWPTAKRITTAPR